MNMNSPLVARVRKVARKRHIAPCAEILLLPAVMLFVQACYAVGPRDEELRNLLLTQTQIKVRSPSVR
jgi:hypothetical protein